MTDTDKPSTAAVDSDSLRPLEYLILEVLAARYRLGEMAWTFPARLRPPMVRLETAGLVTWEPHGERTILARLTPAGVAASMLPEYQPPADRAERAAQPPAEPDAPRAGDPDRAVVVGQYADGSGISDVYGPLYEARAKQLARDLNAGGWRRMEWKAIRIGRLPGQGLR